MTGTSKAKGLVAVAAAGLIALGLSACGSDSGGGSAAGGDTAGGSSGGGKIALLLPESQTTRYESADRPYFEDKVAALCPDCEIIYSNADQDASKQQQQAEAALTNGAQVLVLDPVDSAAAGPIAAAAKAKNVPVISYDRLITGAEIDYYISFDNEKVGQLQGQALLDKLTADGKADGTIVMINGSPTDNNAKLFKQGAHSVIDGSTLKVGAESDTVEWKPANAQSDMDGHITKLGKNGFVGVYAANDGTAGGAIAAMKSAGIDPKTRPVTGQDAELAAIQRIVAGEQFMTVYKAIRPEAEAAAELAVQLLRGETPTATTSPVNNGVQDVPSILLEPVAVTRDNVADTVIADGYQTAADVCTGAYAAACTDLGIK